MSRNLIRIFYKTNKFVPNLYDFDLFEIFCADNMKEKSNKLINLLIKYKFWHVFIS